MKWINESRKKKKRKKKKKQLKLNKKEHEYRMACRSICLTHTHIKAKQLMYIMNRQYPKKLNQNEIGVRVITKKYTNNQATNVEGYRRRGRDE